MDTKTDIEQIRSLADKYFEGDTSLEQEQVLRDYFRTTPLDEIPDDIKDLADMFSFFARVKGEVNSEVKPQYSRKWKLRFTVMSSSAAAAIIIGLFIAAPLLKRPEPITMIVDGKAVGNVEQAAQFANAHLQRVAQMMGGLSRAEDKINSTGKRIIDISSYVNENQ